MQIVIDIPVVRRIKAMTDKQWIKLIAQEFMCSNFIAEEMFDSMNKTYCILDASFKSMKKFPEQPTVPPMPKPYTERSNS